jgi:hypothetical protein
MAESRNIDIMTIGIKRIELLPINNKEVSW